MNADLSVLDKAFATLMNELYGVFNRYNMVCAGFVYMVYNCGKCSGFAASCGSGNEYKTSAETGEIFKLFW